MASADGGAGEGALSVPPSVNEFDDGVVTPRMLEVTVPPDVEAGDTLLVEAPWGDLIEIEVPPDAPSGSVMLVEPSTPGHAPGAGPLRV